MNFKKKKGFLRVIAMLLAVLIIGTSVRIDAEAANHYTINGVTVSVDDFASSPHECWAYANNLYNKIWGHRFSNQRGDGDNLLYDKTAAQTTLTAAHLKEYVSKASLGSVLRICNSQYLYGSDGWGHSQLIVQKDANGFTVLEGGLPTWPYKREKYYTWSEYANTSWLGGKYHYIKYIKWPGAPVVKEMTLTSPKIRSLTVLAEGVRVKWTETEGAEQYRLLRRYPDGRWKTIACTDATEYVDTTARSGKTYEYTVRCVDSTNTVFTSKYRACKEVIFIAAPQIRKLTNAAAGVKVTWKDVNGAQKYRVLRRAEGGSWEKLKDTMETAYLDQDTESGTEYEYLVRCINNEKTAFTSGKNAPVSILRLDAPKINSVSFNEEGVGVRWSAVPGAVKYRVYRSEDGRSWEEVGVTKNTALTDRAVVSGTTYYYSVKCISRDKLAELSGRIRSQAFTYFAAPVIEAAEAAEEGVVLTWSGTENAPMYRVYRRVPDGEWKSLGCTAEQTFIDETAENGAEYEYIVRCVDAEGHKISVHSAPAGLLYQWETEPEDPEEPGIEEPDDPGEPVIEEPADPEGSGSGEMTDPVGL